MTRKKWHSDTITPGGSQRQLRVGELVRHAMAELLARGEVHDPVIEGHLITVPEVRMTADLRLATIYIMPLAGRDADEVLAALERNKKFLRGEIAHRINLKFAPDIRFRIDERFAEAERIDKLLRSPEVKRDLAGRRAAMNKFADLDSRPSTPSERRARAVPSGARGRRTASKSNSSATNATCTAGWCSTSRSA